MNIFAIFEERISGVLEALRAEGLLPQDAKRGGFVIESPPSHRHLSKITGRH
jgi:hypothetical protein